MMGRDRDGKRDTGLLRNPNSFSLPLNGLCQESGSLEA